jgi:hypothetical protein
MALIAVKGTAFTARPASASYMKTAQHDSMLYTSNSKKHNLFREATRTPTRSRSRSRTLNSELQMSSLEQDPEESDLEFTKLVSKLKEFKLELPPPPEDVFILSGDIAALFLYSFLDHFMASLYDSALNSPDAVNTISAHAALEYFATAATEMSGTPTASTLPVWFDTVSSAPFGIIPLSTALPIHHHVQYAPIISTAGMASVVLCSSWLACGYLTGAFRFSNTLGSTQRALAVTAVTWAGTCMIVVSMAYGSDILMGNIDGLHKTVGLTKADVDYIFDSLSVLLIWRFLWSSFFGSGED